MTEAQKNQQYVVDLWLKKLSKLWWSPDATAEQIASVRERYEEEKTKLEEMK